jgi:2-keto-3-deoxy-L-rhamnonate aldolase RhmA
MQWINREKLKQEVLSGTFLNLGSPMAVEIAATIGFDWLLLDLEHGSGSFADLRAMLLACRGSKSAPIVRIRSVDQDSVKFVMDSGAAGVMFPYVSTPEEARRAVQIMKYPPMGARGVAVVTRASDYGMSWSQYFPTTNRESFVIVQIETEEAVKNAEAIASVEGVDALFVGPMDLSVNLGCPGDFTPPHFVESLRQVIAACEKHGKAAGILSRPQLVPQHKELGFRLLALNSDATCLITGLQSTLAELE